MSKEELNENNDQNKKKKKKITIGKVKLQMTLIGIMAVLLVIVMLVSFLYNIFDKVGDAVKGAVDEIIDFFIVDNEGVIQVDDKHVETIIKSITDLGVDIEDIKLMGDVDYNNENIEKANEEALKKYIKKFLEAQAMTQTINTKPGLIDRLLHSYGTVYVYRTEENDTDLSKVRQMGYMEYEKLEQLSKETSISAVNKIRYNYSINPSTGELVVAGWTIVNNSTANIYLRNINYKDAISQFTTPVTFLIYLTMITQNPEFVSAVVDLIQDSEINITIMDNVTTTVETKKYTYTENRKTNELTENRPAAPKTTTTTTTTKSYNPTIAITYAKSWFSEQTITYKKKTNGPTESSSTTTQEDEPEPELPDMSNMKNPQGETPVTWKTNQSTSITTSTTTTQYEEGVRGDVEVRVGKKGDNIRYENGEIKEPTFIGLLDTAFKIPNSTRKEKAGVNFRSGADWFLNLLQKDPACQRLDQVIRYILYIYTGKDYGVTDESIFQMFDANLTSISRDIIVDTRQCAPELVITDIKTLKKAFKGYSGNSELIKNAQAFLDMQNQYHVNALFAAAVSITETSAGRAGNATNGLNNWFNIRGANTTWAHYATPKEGIMRFGWQISEGGFYFTEGNYSVATIGKIYCPNTAEYPDQADKWIENTIGYMVDFYDAAGIDISKYLGGDAAGVVQFALQFVGQNHTTFTSYKTSDGNQFVPADWCAMFVSYCFDKCGAIPSILDKSFTYVPTEWTYYKNKGQTHVKGTYNPKAGDLVFFSNGGEAGMAHVGIVTDYDGTYVYTVEGNTRSTDWTVSVVKTDKYTMSSGWLYGFVEL